MSACLAANERKRQPERRRCSRSKAVYASSIKCESMRKSLTLRALQITHHNADPVLYMLGSCWGQCSETAIGYRIAPHVVQLYPVATAVSCKASQIVVCQCANDGMHCRCCHDVQWSSCMACCIQHLQLSVDVSSGLRLDGDAASSAICMLLDAWRCNMLSSAADQNLVKLLPTMPNIARTMIVNVLRLWSCWSWGI